MHYLNNMSLCNKKKASLVYTAAMFHILFVLIDFYYPYYNITNANRYVKNEKTKFNNTNSEYNLHSREASSNICSKLTVV